MGKSERAAIKIVDPETAQNLIFMMSEVTKNGTGKRAQFSDWEVAGKTGTSQSARDAWFIGFSKHYVAGVWMGYDDNTPLKGVTGGGLPADIWRTAMEEIHSKLTPIPLLADRQNRSSGKSILCRLAAASGSSARQQQQRAAQSLVPPKRLGNHRVGTRIPPAVCAHQRAARPCASAHACEVRHFSFLISVIYNLFSIFFLFSNKNIY